MNNFNKKMSKFIPAVGFIQIEPPKKDSVFGDEGVYQSGTVVSVGNIGKYKIGDTIYFEPHGYIKIVDESDTSKVKYHIVESDMIIGKESYEQKKLKVQKKKLVS